MKNLFLTVVFVLVGTFIFANGNVEKSTTLKKEKIENFMRHSCTVTVSAGTTETSITISCDDCTELEACDAAYRIARLSVQN